MAKDNSDHRVGYAVVVILALLAVASLAVYFMNAGELTEAQVQGKASAVTYDEWELQFENLNSVNSGLMRVTSNIRYLGEEVVPAEDVYVDCYVNGNLAVTREFANDFVPRVWKDIMVESTLLSSDELAKVRCIVFDQDYEVLSESMTYAVE